MDPKKSLEKFALIRFLKNSGIEFNEDLFEQGLDDDGVDVIYNKLKYQVTLPADEAEVESRVLGKKHLEVEKANISGRRVMIAGMNIGQIERTYNTDTAWEDLVFKPIRNKQNMDGKGIILLINIMSQMPPVMDIQSFKTHKHMIPTNSFDKVIVVDSYRNLELADK